MNLKIRRNIAKHILYEQIVTYIYISTYINMCQHTSTCVNIYQPISTLRMCIYIHIHEGEMRQYETILSWVQLRSATLENFRCPAVFHPTSRTNIAYYGTKQTQFGVTNFEEIPILRFEMSFSSTPIVSHIYMSKKKNLLNPDLFLTSPPPQKNTNTQKKYKKKHQQKQTKILSCAFLLHQATSKVEG